jgi:hypothetical protein
MPKEILPPTDATIQISASFSRISQLPGGRISGPPRYQAPGYQAATKPFRRDPRVPGNAAPLIKAPSSLRKWPPASTATRVQPPLGRPPHQVPGAQDPSASATPPRALANTNPATKTIFSRDQGSRDTQQRRNYSIITKLTLQRLTRPKHTNTTTRQKKHTPPHPDNNLPR